MADPPSDGCEVEFPVYALGPAGGSSGHPTAGYGPGRCLLLFTDDDSADHPAWLDPETPDHDIAALLAPYPAERMAVAEAGRAVNSPRNDGPECLTPAA